MAMAIENSMRGGTKRRVSLGTAGDLITTQVLSHILYREDKTLDWECPSIYIEGTMGIGKTMLITQVVDKISNIIGQQMGFVDIRMAGMSGTDLQGIPMPVKFNERDVLVWIKDSLLPGIKGTGEEFGILFLDEINQVEDTSVLSLLYQFLQDKKMNDYCLPEGWVIVSAGNRGEDGGVYNRLPAPIRDRMMILEIALNKEEWLTWAKRDGAHPSVVTFVGNGHSNKEVLHTYDPEMEIDGDEECANYVFATPRSWIQVSNEIKKYERGYTIPGTGQPLYSRETLSAAIAGLLGDELAKAFETFYNLSGSLDVNKYLNLQWVNGSPTEEIGGIKREEFPYLTAVAEISGTIEQKINILYLLGHTNNNSLLKTLQNTLTVNEINQFKDHAVANGNSTLIVHENFKSQA